MRIITYDVEIAEEVELLKDGWASARRGEAGVASLALYDNHTGRVHLYDKRTLHEGIEHLNAASLLVSFNGMEFDRPCLEGVSGVRIVAPEYDILQQVWTALGTRKVAKGTYGLGAICERTLGIGKTGSGVHAPVLFKAGRFAELHDYNINDVHLTRQLFNHIVEYKAIKKVDNTDLEIIYVPEGAFFG